MRHGRPFTPALLLLWCLVCAQTSAPVPFRFIDPAPNTMVAPGAELPVSVSSGPDSGTRRVSYYWYRLEEEPLPLQLAEAALVADASSSPPFGGRVPVPADGIGLLRLLAVAEVAQGRMGTLVEFDERLVTVEPSASMEAIEFTVDQPWLLTPVGRLAPVPAVGLFSDGVARSLEQGGVAMAVHSDDERVVRVLEGGLIRAIAPGKATLTVKSRDRRASL